MHAKNDNMKKTVLAKLSADDASRMLAEAHEKEIWDQMSRECIAKEEGKLEGKTRGQTGRQTGNCP